MIYADKAESALAYEKTEKEQLHAELENYGVRRENKITWRRRNHSPAP